MDNHSSVQSSPFLRLPAELRNVIYGYVFGDPSLTDQVSYTCEAPEPTGRISGYEASFPPPHRERKTNVVNENNHPLSLIYANRQIHAETHLLPYTYSIFRFEGVASLEKFMKNRSKAQKGALKNLEIDMMRHECGDYHSVFTQRKWIKSLSGMYGAELIRLNECGFATDSMVDNCVIDVFRIVSKSSPEVTIKAEGHHPYRKGQWMLPVETRAGMIEVLEGMGHLGIASSALKWA